MSNGIKKLRNGLLALLLAGMGLLLSQGTAWAEEPESLAASEPAGSWEQTEDIFGAEVQAQISAFSLEAPEFGSCYGDQLGDNEQVIYQALESAGLASVEEGDSLNVELRGSGLYLFGMEYTQEQWEQGAYREDPDYQAMRAEAERSVLRAYDAYLKDYMEDSYWIQGLSYYFTVGITEPREDGGQRLVIASVTLSPTPYYNGIGAERQAVSAALDEAESEISLHLREGADRTAVLGAIHDWLAERITYGTASPSGSAHTITGALLDTYNHQGVCEAYAKLFQIFCGRWNIPCVVAVGRSTASTTVVDHMWNYVQLEDGNWYLVDVTWDDTASAAPSREWFLAGAEQVNGNHLFSGVFMNFNGAATYTPFVSPTLPASSWSGESLVHSWSQGESQGADCESEGYQLYVCTCGAEYREVTAAALGHSWGSWQTVTQATTSSQGLQRRTCSRCGRTEEQSTAKLPATQQNLVTEFVTRLYQLALGRTPTQAEAADWVNRLLNGSFTGAQVAEGFVNSAEYKRKNTSDTSYVEMLYRVLMNREPRADETVFWTDYLYTGVTRNFVLQGFLNSTEFRRLCGNYGITAGSWVSTDVRDQNPDVTAFVARLYRTCLGREPDDSGMLDWVTWLVNGSQTGTQVAKGFVFSAEFQRKQLSNDAFVEALYRALFDRSSDTSGKQTWMNCLASGWSREQVLAGFTDSAEFSRLCARYGIQR